MISVTPGCAGYISLVGTMLHQEVVSEFEYRVFSFCVRGLTVLAEETEKSGSSD